METTKLRDTGGAIQWKNYKREALFHWICLLLAFIDCLKLIVCDNLLLRACLLFCLFYVCLYNPVQLSLESVKGNLITYLLLLKTYVAQFVQVAEQVVRLGEHEMTLDLHVLQRFHETLQTHTDKLQQDISSECYSWRWTFATCELVLLSYDFCYLSTSQWCHQLRCTGARAPSTSNNFILVHFRINPSANSPSIV